MSSAPSPAGTRLARPRWFSIRVLAGVILIAASMLIGAHVLGSARETVSVWSVTRDVAAGTVLDSDDRVAVEVNLGRGIVRYIDASADIAGLVTNRALAAGELIPLAALQDLSDGRLVTIPVAAEHMNEALQHGTVADLYLVADDPDRTGATVQLVREAMTINSVTAPAASGLSSVGAQKFQVGVVVHPDGVADLVRHVQQGQLLFIPHTGARTSEDPQ